MKHNKYHYIHILALKKSDILSIFEIDLFSAPNLNSQEKRNEKSGNNIIMTEYNAVKIFLWSDEIPCQFYPYQIQYFSFVSFFTL